MANKRTNAPARVRWSCPKGAHKDQLGSRRPRKNATVRYCLECSKTDGVLVERVCHTLERERQKAKDARDRERARAQERQRKAHNKRQAARDEKAAVESFVQAEFKKALALPSIQQAERDLVAWIRENRLYMKGFNLRRRNVCNVVHQSGISTGDPYVGSVKIKVAKSQRKLTAKDRTGIAELVVHEVAHMVAIPDNWGGKRVQWHGPGWRKVLVAAVEERWGVKAAPYERRKAYDLDDLIIERMVEAGVYTEETEA